MKIVFFLFITLLFISCRNTPDLTKSSKQKKIPLEFKLNKADYVILSYDNLNFLKKAKPAALSREELNEIEKILKNAIKDNNEKYKEVPEMQIHLEHMKRQYVPYFNEKGEKVVWINFFCYDPENPKDESVEDTTWRKNLIIVSDGGNCYFSIEINLTTKSYSNLMINGLA